MSTLPRETEAGRPPWLARFMARVFIAPGGCWIWQGQPSSVGYGRFTIEGVVLLAHRVSYAHFVGPIPDGLQLDHLCRVRMCVNPSHLEAVTSGENTRRGTNRAVCQQIWERREECPKGHPYTEASTFVDGRGSLRCRICARARQRRWRAGKAARAA